MSYIDYPIKCQACGLHYTVHSWQEDWHQTEGGTARAAPTAASARSAESSAGRSSSRRRSATARFSRSSEQPPDEITAIVAPGIG